MEISAQAVKALREETGAGILECRNALAASEGDVKKAKAWLEERGLKKAEKVTGREAKQGLIETYVHQGRVGAMVEISCETDFVARTEDFQKLAKDVALHVAGLSPKYVSVEEIPADVIEEAKKDFGDNLNKFYEENVLLSQPFVRDAKVSIADLLTQAKAKLGENIVIRRFIRYELGK
ncbi:MAG: elongation factor Ts [Chloroflexi bacterium]|nr:elongation factor Ts [Chloroflexota bacterium]OJV97549.1 MAG: elongation factor Ts [Chloroflexi bacterium 54-19]